MHTHTHYADSCVCVCVHEHICTYARVTLHMYVCTYIKSLPQAKVPNDWLWFRPRYAQPLKELVWMVAITADTETDASHIVTLCR